MTIVRADDPRQRISERMARTRAAAANLVCGSVHWAANAASTTNRQNARWSTADRDLDVVAQRGAESRLPNGRARLAVRLVDARRESQNSVTSCIGDTL
jgi:hypothetical protein